MRVGVALQPAAVMASRLRDESMQGGVRSAAHDWACSKPSMLSGLPQRSRAPLTCSSCSRLSVWHWVWFMMMYWATCRFFTPEHSYLILGAMGWTVHSARIRGCIVGHVLASAHVPARVHALLDRRLPLSWRGARCSGG